MSSSSSANDSPKVVRFSGHSRLEWSAAEVLRYAQEQEFTEVIVIGVTPGSDIYFDSTQAHPADVNWLLDKIKGDLLGWKPAG